MNIHIWIY